jgi:Tfp pilus assembly protein PilO
MHQKAKTNNVVGLSMVIVILCLILAGLNLVPMVKVSRERASVIRNELNQAQDKLDAFDTADQRIAEIKQTIEKVAIAVPENADYQSTLVSLEAIAAKEGMAINSLQPATAGLEKETVFPSTAFSFSTTGDYPHVSSFIKDLENNLRIMKIKTMSLSQVSADAVQLSATVNVFSRTKSSGGSND